MTEFLNTLSEHWYDWQIDMLWQVTVLIAIIWGVDVLIRKWAWPQVRYALWMLVLVKLLIPPTFTSPASITSHIPDAASRAATVMERANASKTNSYLGTSDFSEQDNPSIGLKSQHAIVGDAPVAVKQSEAGALETSVLSQPSPAGAIQNKASISQPVLSWKTWAMFTWLTGIIILSVWLVMRLTNLRREHVVPVSCHSGPRAGIRDDIACIAKQSDVNNLPDRFYQLLKAAAAKVGLKKLPRVILTDKVACPAVFGVFRPVLLMPERITGVSPVNHGRDGHATMSARDTEHILLHELAHIKRGDLAVHAVYMILQVVYWFNPLLWLIRRTLQNLRELCCDATVARLLREDTVHYRQTLLETARRLVAEPVDPGLGLLGLFENSNWLVVRLKWLEKKTWKNRKLRITVIALLVAFMATCVLPMAVFNPGTPDFVIRGMVTDARTSQPVVGAKVGDNKRYNKGEFCTVTDSDGHYEYKTWYEEHGTIAEADGYKSQLKGFNTKIFGSEKEKVINFELVPVTVVTIEQIMKQADNEARQLNHEYIGTEHLLLALMSDENTYAYEILKDLDVNTEKVQSEITKLIKSGTDPVTKENLPLPPRAEKALEYAEAEAKSLNQDTIRSEHLLLGLLRVEDGVAAGVLENMGVRYDDVYQKIIHSGNEDQFPQNIEANSQGTDRSNGILEAVLLPEHFDSHTVLSMKTGQFISQQQADNSKLPYLYYGCLAPKASENYTIDNSPDAYYGVEACNMDLGDGGWAPESKALQTLWSINSIEQFPKIPSMGTFTYGEQEMHGVFISLPPDKQWPYITAFKGDDGTCGVFEITKVRDRKIYIRFKVLNPPDESTEQPTQTSTVPYNTIIERTLYAAKEHIFDCDLFDFRTNKVSKIEGDVKFWDYPKWYAEQGIDMICIPSKQGPTLSGDGRVSGSFGHYGGNLCKFVKTDLGMDCSAADLDNAWETGESMETIDHGGWDNLPARFFFKSRDGDSGLLEVTALDEIEKAITFRYKLFKADKPQTITQNSKPTTKDYELQTENFTATLPSGVTVELLGLGTAPWKDRQQWWKPGGTDMNQPELKFPFPLLEWKDQPNGAQFTCAALCKLSNHPDISVSSVNFSNGLMAGASFLNDGMQLTYIIFPLFLGEVPEKTDMKLAIASEKFVQAKPLGDFTPQQHQSYYLENNKDHVILHPVRIGNFGTPCVDMTCNLVENTDVEFSVSAKLKNGNTETWSSGQAGKDVFFYQSTPKRNNTKIEDIEEIIIKYRPWEWVTFKNVALTPGSKTDVKIAVGENQSAADKAATAPNNVTPDRDPGGSDTMGRSAEARPDNPLMRKVETVTFKKDMPLAEALRVLAQMYQVNIIPSEQTANPCTTIAITNLYDVTFEDILKALCGTTHAYVKQGNLIHVYTIDEFEAIKDVNLRKAKDVLKEIEGAYVLTLSKFTLGDIDAAKVVLESALPYLDQLERAGQTANFETSLFITQYKKVIELINQGENERAQALFEMIGEVGRTLESEIQQVLEKDTTYSLVKEAALGNFTAPPDHSSSDEGPVDITPANFTLHFDEQRGTYSPVVSIANNTDATLPKHKLRFYRGDPNDGLDETGHAHSGWHEAGPIEPGQTWNESTYGFALPDGDYAFTVILDYDSAVPETDETNNQKTITVKIQNSRIMEN